MRATYNITDDRLRLYPDGKLSDEDYRRVTACQFQWWPKQGCFSAKWRLGAEDVVLSLVEEIEDDDTMDDVEARVERFEQYAERDEAQAAQASERVAQANTARRLRMAEQTQAKKLNEALYWQQRIAGAIRRMKQHDKPATCVKRIKGLEADLRVDWRALEEHQLFHAYWSTVQDRDRALMVANRDRSLPSRKYLKAEFPKSLYEGDMNTWSALDDDIVSWEEARGWALERHAACAALCLRSIRHVQMRIAYERDYLQALADGRVLLERPAFEMGDVVVHEHRLYRVLRVNKRSVEMRRLANTMAKHLSVEMSAIRRLMVGDEVLVATVCWQVEQMDVNDSVSLVGVLGKMETTLCREDIFVP